MNYKNIKYLVLLWLGVAAVQSCSKVKDFGDTNLNPNATTSPIPSALLTNVIARMGGDLVYDAGGVNTGAGLYSQLFSETQYTEVSRYNKPTYNYDNPYYAGPLEDLQNIINYNSDPGTAPIAAQYGSNKNQIAVARILKVHYYKLITDAVGDIPYFSALKGVGTVPYDKQSDIYPALIKELKEAVDQFDNGKGATGDVLFGGDNSKWRKYANSLRMMLALNLEKVDPTTGKTEFNAALTHSAGIIANNSDNVVLNFPGGNYPSTFYNYYYVTQRKDYAVSKTMTDKLTSMSDPRIGAYADNTIGFPYGLTRDNAVAFANANPNWSFILNTAWRGQATPLTILGAANIDLVRAEAAQLGWTGENVATLYANGIMASFQQWGVYNATTYATYMANPSVALSAGTEMQKIASQAWLAWNPSGLEAFDVYRRTGFPALVPAPGLASIPRRMPYGVNDYSYNPANVADAASRYTANGVSDSQYAKVWWDK
jgi:hypothetical protein